MTTQMIIRLEPELKNKVSRIAQNEGKNLSELVRELLENYIKERDMGEYIDELWDRIGHKMKSHGITPGDIQKVIKQVRDN